MPSLTLSLDSATFEKLNDLAGGEIRATATALLSAALDHTTRDLEMKLTRQRVAQVQTALEQFSANFSTRTEAELERFLLRAKAQLEELSGRIESALGKLAAGERRLAELLSVARFVVRRSGAPWRRKIELIAAPVRTN